MLRTNVICVKKVQDSKPAFYNVKECIEKVMQKNASAINFRINDEGGALKVVFEKPISFQTVNKFLLALDDRRIRIKQVTLERKEIGPFFEGHMEIIIF